MISLTDISRHVKITFESADPSVTGMYVCLCNPEIDWTNNYEEDHSFANEDYTFGKNKPWLGNLQSVKAYVYVGVGTIMLEFIRKKVA